MIVDTHVHYMEPPKADRPHHTGSVNMDKLTVHRLLEEARKAGVDKIVQVNPAALAYDNRYSLEAAEQYERDVVGVIGRFDPLSERVEEEVVEFLRHPAAIGVRFAMINTWNESWLRDRSLDRVLRLASTRGFPVQIFAPNMSLDLRDTARRFPDVRIIADHMGVRYVPTIGAADTFRYWDESLALAREPNVWLKVSHFPEASSASERYPYPTSIEKFKELYDLVGAKRLIWGSNYPPVQRACSYRHAVDFVRVECSFLSPEDKAAILGGNFLSEFASVQWKKLATTTTPASASEAAR